MVQINKKKRKRLNIKNNKVGQAMVEMALVLPLLLLLLCGIFDFGWIFAHQISLNNTSRDGARFAAINYNKVNLETLVREKLQGNDGMGGGADLIVDVVKEAGRDVKVTVTKKVKVLTPLLGIFLPDQEVSLKSKTVMWGG